MKPIDYCLGCNTFVTTTRYRILPKEHFPESHDFPLCFKCRAALMVIVANAELRNGNHKYCQQLEIPHYYFLLRKFIKGEN